MQHAQPALPCCATCTAPPRVGPLARPPPASVQVIHECVPSIHWLHVHAHHCRPHTSPARFASQVRPVLQCVLYPPLASPRSPHTPIALPGTDYRTTKFLSSEGFYAFLNWFDDRAWYPLGRIIGGTIYPGLMATAAAIHGAMNYLNISVNIRNMCVFLAPLFAALTALSTYLMTVETVKRESTGLVAAALVAIVPSYISRSVGGSYDNEGVAIFALVFTFYMWVRAVNTGSLKWACGAALAYFYMVAAWGGYVFIINIIPIYVTIMILGNMYTPRLYVAYSTFYVLGSIMAMNVPFVGFNVVEQAECAASHGVFILVQVRALYDLLGIAKLSAATIRRAVSIAAAAGVLLVAGTLITMQLLGKTQWTGRSLSLLDPTYASKYIPIIASVSEHQPTSWTSFFFDLHICVPFAPVGLYFLFQDINDGKVFLILYGTITWYFAGVMVRLMLTLAPAACMLAAVGLSEVLNTFAGHVWLALSEEGAAALAAAEAKGDASASGSSSSAKRGGSKKKKSSKDEGLSALLTSTYKGPMVPFPIPVAASVLLGILSLLCFYALHATYVASEAYSSPSIVLASRRADGSKVIFDDFREAYYWLRMNTAPDAKIMSWWDYGYQTSAMGNRTVLVDNNTWNNTHIATVGRAMSSTEADAYPIMESLDVDYVLAIFGGYTGYSGDDINKFLWMVRIGGGVFPHIKEPDYFSGGQFRVDSGGSPTLLNCMMYKMCFYRFDELNAEWGRPTGFDRARNVEYGHKGYELTHLDEAFTSEHWIVRIFKVKKRSTFDALPTAPSVLDPARTKRVTSPSFSKKTSPDPKFVGCVTSESAFSADKAYAGGTTGAHFSLAKAHAESHSKQFVAIARSGVDGHAFAFNSLQVTPDPAGSPGCHVKCNDDQSKRCGCADAACGRDPVPAGEEHNRRWAVYRMPSSQ